MTDRGIQTMMMVMIMMIMMMMMSYYRHNPISFCSSFLKKILINRHDQCSGEPYGQPTDPFQDSPVFPNFMADTLYPAVLEISSCL